MSSNIAVKEIEHCRQLIVQKETDFNEIAKIHGAVNFKKECAFAIQALEKNNYLMGKAKANPSSLGHAIMNVATIGLSLSPVHRMAYLVPRGNEICLDISYMGLVQLAIDCGIVKAVRAEVVYSKDKFELLGFGKEPRHEFNPFEKDRGDIVGAYCIALTNDDLYLVDTMTIEQINSIKNRSESGKKGTGPWITDFIEMAKKSVIKRAYKLWPKPSSEKAQRFAEAIDVTNSADPIDLSNTEAKKVESEIVNDELFIEIRTCLELLNKTEADFVKHLKTTFNREEIEKIEDLTTKEANESFAFLKSIVEKQTKKTSPTPLKSDEQKQEKKKES